ncbi:hypothetical protein C0991_008206 [Blastosporella zonata]|nr:hypothetical protein C0991_008206 [Blastosporella zonata]
MLVKAGKYVDVSGRCDIEYTQHWARKSEGCNVVAMSEAMQDQFSREPPMYAKPTEPVISSRPSPGVDPRSRPPPPLPPSHHMSSPARAISPDRPEIPPRPVVGALYSQSSTQSRTVTSPIPVCFYSPTRLSHGSKIKQETTQPERPPPSPHLDTLPQYRSVYGPPTTPPRYAMPEGTNQSHHNPHAMVAGQIMFPRSPPPPPPSLFTPPPLSYSAHQPHIQEARLEPVAHPVRAPIVNLLDEDSPETLPNVMPALAPPPPRPPNPELLQLHEQVHHKLTSELSSLSQALAVDAERLRAHQGDLLAGEPAIRDEMARLEAVRDVCRNVAGRFKGSVRQAEANIGELRRKGDPEVDELICSTTIVYNQLISLVAEDNAIEDTIYHLHRALNSGRIDLERFLRSTRLLAEEQFMKRALIERIQKGIPMGMSMSSDWS